MQHTHSDRNTANKSRTRTRSYTQRAKHSEQITHTHSERNTANKSRTRTRSYTQRAKHSKHTPTSRVYHCALTLTRIHLYTCVFYLHVMRCAVYNLCMRACTYTHTHMYMHINTCTYMYTSTFHDKITRVSLSHALWFANTFYTCVLTVNVLLARTLACVSTHILTHT
jgi:hypothetical protein